MKRVHFLLIGNGVASNSAIGAIRKRDKKSSILLIGEEEFDFYYRPQLPDYLLDRISLERIIPDRAKFYEENKVEVLKGKRVVKILPDRKEVCLDDGFKISYSKLLIATGLYPYRSTFGFQNLSDAHRLRDVIDKTNDVLIAGEYIFLLELIRALLGKGKRITYLCRGRRLLGTLLDERASWHLEQLLLSKGVNLLYNTQIEKVDVCPDGKYLIQTDQGGKICVDIYFEGEYEDRNKEMFLEAGLDYAEAGIWVDRFMRTNKDDIFAAGDVARVRDGYPPNILRVGWQRAKMQGEVAGANMCGEAQQFNPFSTAIHIRFGRINFLIAGQMPPDAKGEDIILESMPDNYYKRVHIEDGMVKGFVFVGGTKGLARVKELLAAGAKLTSSEKFVLQKDLVEGYGDTISVQMACPTCKTILDLPMTIDVGKKVICEVCGAESIVSRTRVSMVKYLELA